MVPGFAIDIAKYIHISRYTDRGLYDFSVQHVLEIYPPLICEAVIHLVLLLCSIPLYA